MTSWATDPHPTWTRLKDQLACLLVVSTRLGIAAFGTALMYFAAKLGLIRAAGSEYPNDLANHLSTFGCLLILVDLFWRTTGTLLQEWPPKKERKFSALIADTDEPRDFLVRQVRNYDMDSLRYETRLQVLEANPSLAARYKEEDAREGTSWAAKSGAILGWLLALALQVAVTILITRWLFALFAPVGGYPASPANHLAVFAGVFTITAAWRDVAKRARAVRLAYSRAILPDESIDALIELAYNELRAGNNTKDEYESAVHTASVMLQVASGGR